MTIVFTDYNNRNYIKSWPNVEYSKVTLPGINDYVILHWGDYNEKEEYYRVKGRIYDGAKLDVVELLVEYIPEGKDGIN